MNKEVMKKCSEIMDKFAEAFIYYYPSNLELKNSKKAFDIFKELADEGFALAQYYMGIMLCKGEGVERDVDKGREALKRAEKEGQFLMLEGLRIAGCLSKEEAHQYAVFCKSNGYTALGMQIETQIRNNNLDVNL